MWFRCKTTPWIKWTHDLGPKLKKRRGPLIQPALVINPNRLTKKKTQISWPVTQLSLKINHSPSNSSCIFDKKHLHCNAESKPFFILFFSSRNGTIEKYLQYYRVRRQWHAGLPTYIHLEDYYIDSNHK